MSKSLIALKETTDEEIINRIRIIRGQKVMLDKDLAEMYGVEVKVLNQSVKRNFDRFPHDFMFQLSDDEWSFQRSQIVTFEKGKGKYSKFTPYAFTEHGVLALSFVLRSERAVQVSEQIIRVYVKMRQLLIDNKDLWQKIEKIEQSLMKKDEEIAAIFKVLKKLLIQEEKPRTKIGFTIQAKQK